jgi:CheY-like chemotaxis protein
MADDDEDDRLLTSEALKESRVINTLHCVENGEQLLQYLNNEGFWSDATKFPKPSLILLDLNMPRVDGREALTRIKSDPRFRTIPVIILTTSKTEEDMLIGYDLGAASYITKPVTFEKLTDLMKALGRYWIEFVELPNSKR